MPNEISAQSFQHGSDSQQPEDLIRDGYKFGVSHGRKFVVPDALLDLEVPLARSQKPDFSSAMKANVGVRYYFVPSVLR